MVQLGVVLYLVLAIVGGGAGEVKVDIDNQQRVPESTKEQEMEGRPRSKEHEEGRRSSRELQQFQRPTTLQRMLEEASLFRWCRFSVNIESGNSSLKNSNNMRFNFVKIM